MQEITQLGVKQKEKRDLYWKAPLIAFALTTIIYLILVVISQKYPLGKYLTLMSDMEVQYVPFLFLQKYHLGKLDFGSVEKLVSSLTYSFELGAGKNIMGTFGYYLASPINLVVLLFDEMHVNEFVLFLMGIKLAAASSFMCIFMHERSANKESKLPILFGIIYAFTSYTMVFMMNIMWLDGYALLPLLLYFIERFMKDGKKTGIALTLLWMFLANYYIAYMAGVFSFIYLIVRMIEEKEFADRKQAFKKIGTFVLTAVLCAMTLCIVLFPVGLDTIGSSDPTQRMSDKNYVQFTAMEFLDQLFLGYEGEFADIMISNMPFIFISNAVTLLCITFFVSKAAPKREKLIYGICSALVFFSLMVTAFDVAWQVFDAPNWFWHRESFVFIPFFMVIAYKALEKIRETDNKAILTAAGILLALLFAAQSFGEMKKREAGFLFNLCMIVIFAGIFILMKKDKWHEQLRNMPVLLPAILSIFLIFETAFFGPVMSSGTATLSVTNGDAVEYLDSLYAVSDCVNASRIAGNGFRTDMEYAGEWNGDYAAEASLYYADARSISLFNSNSNKSLHRFFKQLGYSVNYNYFTSKRSFAAPDTDAFFSLGCVFGRYDYSAARFVAEDDAGTGLRFYVNENVLPLSFAVNSGAFGFDFYQLETAVEGKNYFEMRNDWYRSMFPEAFVEDFYTAPVRTPGVEFINTMNVNMKDYINSPETEDATSVMTVPDSSTSVFDPDKLGLEVTGDYEETLTTLYRVNKEIPIVIDYTIRAEGGKELYVNVSGGRCLDEYSVYVNGEYINGWADGSFYSSVSRVGAFEDGEEVHVSIVADADKFTYESINFAYLDYETFSAQFAGIDKSNVSVQDLSEGYVTISADLKAGETLLTTIPYEKGWTLYVDGVETPIKVYQESFIGVDCGPGHHDIKLVFAAPGFKAGACASVLGIVGFITWGIIASANRKKTIANKKEKTTANGGKKA